MSNLSIIVPVKQHSLRCENKNFRPFVDGHSLFTLKLAQLRAAGVASESIVVATDNKAALQSSGGYRTLDDSKHNSTFTEALDFWLYNVSDDDVAIVHVTCPLFDEFAALLQRWALAKQQGYDSLVVVRPYRHFLLNQRGRGVNFQFGPWHETSQQLPEWYEMTCAAYVIHRHVACHCHYYIGLNPALLILTGPHVDIDSQEDFDLAKLLYRQKHNR